MILVFPYLSITETQANLKSEGVLSVGPLKLEITKNLQRQVNAKRQSAHKSIGLRWQHEMDYLPKRHGTRWPETLSYCKVRTTVFYFLSSFFFLIFFFLFASWRFWIVDRHLLCPKYDTCRVPILNIALWNRMQPTNIMVIKPRLICGKYFWKC